MDRQSKIAAAYSRTAKINDNDKPTPASFFMKMVFQFAFRASSDNEDISHKAEVLSWVPDNFSGKMLEVPCANGRNTIPYYKKWTSGEFVAIDYTDTQVELAKKNGLEAGLNNVNYIQGDVGNLNFKDEEFDIVYSWMGFHVFPDKESAFKETYRVLKKGGLFIGCFYIEGEVKRTDWFVKNVFVRQGTYTGPFETKDSLIKRLNSMYSSVEIKIYNSIVLFKCVK